MDINEDSEGQFTYAMQLVTTIALPMVLSNVIKLKVLEVIEQAGPHARLSAHEIASRLSISNDDAPDKIDRMLRLLASYSVVTCNRIDNESKSVRLYGLAPVAKQFIPNEDGVSLGPMLELHNDKVGIDTWFKLKDSVREGGFAFEKVHGIRVFEHSSLDERFNEVYNKAMADTSTILMQKILKYYPGFKNLKCVVDVGGGFGTNISMIVSKHPNIKGINSDLPHVIEHAPLYKGVQHVKGDMFQNVPHGDGIFLKWVLHCFNDDDCVKLLKNCYKALRDGGTVIVVEKILPFLPNTSSSVKTATHMDAIMLTQSFGGKERTEDQFLSIAKEAGFDGIRKACFVCNHWVMEFYK